MIKNAQIVHIIHKTIQHNINNQKIIHLLTLLTKARPGNKPKQLYFHLNTQVHHR